MKDYKEYYRDYHREYMRKQRQLDIDISLCLLRWEWLSIYNEKQIFSSLKRTEKNERIRNERIRNWNDK